MKYYLCNNEIIVIVKNERKKIVKYYVITYILYVFRQLVIRK